jgi:uncharacterized damage-inducible protein DinB
MSAPNANFILYLSPTHENSMTLAPVAIKILNQLRDLVGQIHESDFTKSPASLSGSTIGQHVRHTLEFFLCLETGYTCGVVNYDKRAHDKTIETDKRLAMNTATHIVDWISLIDEHRNIRLEARYDTHSDEYISVQTNTLRELIYNIEHAVHHMAIIKIAVREISPYVSLDPAFGIAASTLRAPLADSEVSNRLS